MIGTQIQKPVTDWSNYTTVALWCNAHKAMIEDKGDWYEVVALPEPPKPTAAAPSAEQAPEDRGSALRTLLQQVGKLDRRQENLLNALKPFLKPERREKVDRAMQAARISRLAGAALRGRDQKDP